MGRGRPQKFDEEKVARAIRKSDGNFAQAAKFVGCTRRTVNRYVKKFEVCQQAAEDARGELIESAVQTFRDLLEDEETDDNVRSKTAQFIVRHYDKNAKQRVDVTSDDEKVEKQNTKIEAAVRAVQGDE